MVHFITLSLGGLENHRMRTSGRSRVVIAVTLATFLIAAGTATEAQQHNHDRSWEEPRYSSPPGSGLSDARMYKECQLRTNTSVPAGIKGKVVSTAVKVLAKMIRNGGKYVGKVLRYLDDDAAVAFRKHSKKIAKELDRIAKIPDLTTRVVKEQLYNFLKNTVGLNGGTALEIADAVKAVLDWIVF